MPSNCKMRKRILVSVSCERDLHESLIDFVGKEITELFGGVTFLPGVGFWSSEGALFKDRYEAEIQREEITVILLSVMLNREMEAFTAIEEILCKAKKKLNLHYEYVHVESEQVVVNHLEIFGDKY